MSAYCVSIICSQRENIIIFYYHLVFTLEIEIEVSALRLRNFLHNYSLINQQMRFD